MADRNGTIKGLALLLVFLILASAAIKMTGTNVRHDRYEEMIEAASRMEKCEEALKAERLRRGIPLDKEDYLEIGLLGCSSSSITTTVGVPEAKRTSMVPDMAAMCVRILDEAGLKKGDTIGACYSGSFPALNIALVCAADSMGIHIVYTAAIGASSYGANLPEFTSPEMLCFLYEQGLISTKPAAVTLGGDGDLGQNMIGYLLGGDDRELNAVIDRLEQKGLKPIQIESYEENVKWRMQLYGELDGFVNVGGNVAGTGRYNREYMQKQGILKDSGMRLSENSGLLEQYLRKGIPAVQLLNLKRLCLEYHIAYDPVSLEKIGTSGVYYTKTYAKPLILLTVFIAFGWLLYLFKGKDMGIKILK